MGYHNSGSRVFTNEQEELLEAYLKEASEVFFGLRPREVRSLAYECAMHHNITVPNSWIENKTAGVEWFRSLRKRRRLSIRVPEATSLGRASGFNRSNVGEFFKKLGEVMDKYKFEREDIWNADETGLTTVQKPPQVVAPTGTRQVGSMTSAERGELVTVCAAVNAYGNKVPPMLIFPRARYKEHFVRDGPPGCLGASYPSGWMTTENFKSFLVHFVKHTKCSPERPALLLLDNHESHLGIEGVEYAKQNGVVMMSFPPHCSHQLQPLDRSVFGPLKAYADQHSPTGDQHSPTGCGTTAVGQWPSTTFRVSWGTYGLWRARKRTSSAGSRSRASCPITLTCSQTQTSARL